MTRTSEIYKKKKNKINEQNSKGTFNYNCNNIYIYIMKNHFIVKKKKGLFEKYNIRPR